MNTLLVNSFLTAGAATLLATFFGLAAALTLIALPAVWRRFAIAASLLAWALPPFLIVNCWLHYLGNTGVWRAWMPLNIFGLGGVIWILSLMLWPISLLASLGSWRALDKAHFEAEPDLRRWQLVRWLLWPAARSMILCSAIFAFALALNQFSVPAILQVKVLPVEAWIQFNAALNPVEALAASWPLIVAPIIALILFRAVEVSWPAQSTTPASAIVRRQLGTRWFVACASLTGIVLLASVGLPLFQLLTNPRTWVELPRVWQASWPVALNSAVFAGGAACLAIASALLTWRFRVASVLWVSFLAPGMVVGIAVIWLFNRPVLDVVYRSFAIVLFALALRYAAPVWGLVRASFRNSDTALLDAARLEGLSRWSIFWHVYWPQRITAVFGAWYLAYLLCLWDVEIVTLLYPPGAETLALRIFNLLHYGHDAQVNALCLSLLTIAAAPAAIYAAFAALRKSPAV